MDARRLARLAGAVCLVVGPIAIAASVPPYSQDDPTGQQLAVIVAHPAAADLANVIQLFALAMVPAMFAAAWLARRGAPVLALVGGAVSALAWMAGMSSLATMGIVTEAAAGVADRQGAVAVIDATNAHPVYGVLVLTFVLGHLVGMLVLGIGLWRARVAPAWMGLLFAVSPILHAVGHAIGPGVDSAAYGLLAVATTGLAVLIVRMRDGDRAGPGAASRATSVSAR